MSIDPLIGYSHLHATGVRTFNLLVSYSEGANHAVEEISKRISLTVIKNNIQTENVNEFDNFRTLTLPLLLSHPHTASAYLIGTGDESTPLHKIINELLHINTATEYLSINNGSDEAMAVTIATSGATDLSTQSLPGLAELLSPKVVLGYKTKPSILDDLVARSANSGISLDVRQFSSEPYADLRAWMLEGNHVIISFIPDDMYPIGTLLTPVINVSSGSTFHRKFLDDFDVQESDATDSIIEELLGVISRVRTFSEYTRTSIPLMPMPLGIPDPLKDSRLVILNPALENLALDIAGHFANVDFLGTLHDWSDLPEGDGQNIVLSTGSSFEWNLLSIAPQSVQLFDLSEIGSLGALAESVNQFISAQK